ncbi:unannotated protein [freshwater metagenome]|uniref:Unannotated protein n=1 Tax=freshwater metagenome TaxID=449393 RepID=A0A6J7IIQ4_9ZZZZ|nr:hypothetical protein [Actinomycetota bacterium]
MIRPRGAPHPDVEPLSPRRGGRRRGLTALTAAVMLALCGAGTAGAAGWQYADFDGDPYWDAATMDHDANGYTERIWFDLDDDGGWDTLLYDTRGRDDFLEVVDYDMDENGGVEFRLVDGDGRVGYEYLYVDRNQNGRWDLQRNRARRIIPGSSADAVTRTNIYNVNSRTLHDFTMRTGGGSLLHPSFPTP